MIRTSRPAWRLAAIATSFVAGLTAVSAAPASADSTTGQPSPQVVASELNSPRHLRWSGGALYVAESGVGGSGACVEGAEGEACYGATGSITRIKHGQQRRVVRGLPSIAGEGGAGATGPSDVLVRGKRYTVALGLGADPAVRSGLNARGQKLGTVSTGRFGRPGLRVVADVGDYEATANPDGELPADTNPVALLQRGKRSYVVDAGGNTLLRYNQRGRIRTTAVFESTQVAAPPFLGLPPGATVPMDAVPTAAAFGPDGAIYVSQLTGFPFPVGGASIWKVVPGHEPTKFATGLTNVTDLSFGRDGSLYAVQFADEGLLAGPTATGSVVRIPRGGGAQHETVVDDLASPYGLALRGRSAYVTVCSVCAGEGQVLRVPLRSVS